MACQPTSTFLASPAVILQNSTLMSTGSAIKDEFAKAAYRNSVFIIRK
jgi:hypothetical protein